MTNPKHYHRFFFYLSIITLITIKKYDATILECEFKTYDDSHWGTRYTCIAKNFKTTLSDRTITEVNGLHENGKTNADVRRLFIKKQSCSYLPLNIASQFPNLEILYVMNSNVQHLFDGDLDGLTNLKVFDVSHNPIEQLGKDFFQNCVTIEKLSFYNCHLKFIDAKALDPLVNLKLGVFDNNVCFDSRGADASGIRELKAQVRRYCQNEDNEDHIFNRHEEMIKCQSLEHDLSKTKALAYITITFLVIALVALIVVLMKIFKSTFSNNWLELKNTLI